MTSKSIVGPFLLIVLLQAMWGAEAAAKKSTTLKKGTEAPRTAFDQKANISQAINLGDLHSAYKNTNFVKVTTNSSICGGVMISRRHLLTTASCVRMAQQDKFLLNFAFQSEVVVDEYPNYIGTGSEWIEHPKFKLDTKSDKYNLALVRFTQDVFVNRDDINISCDIDFGESSPGAGTEIILFGLGQSDNSGGVCVSSELLGARLKVKPMSYCNTYSIFTSLEDTNFLCVAHETGHVGACTYDEGGPVLKSDSLTLVGIIGRQPNPCPPSNGFPSKIIKFTTEIVCWIQEQTKEEFGATCLAEETQSPCLKANMKNSRIKTGGPRFDKQATHSRNQ